jgi:hypothetical protein
MYNPDAHFISFGCPSGINIEKFPRHRNAWKKFFFLVFNSDIANVANQKAGKLSDEPAIQPFFSCDGNPPAPAARRPSVAIYGANP